MRRLIFITVLLSSALIQAQQIAITRIEAMPSMPQPYLMRNWKQVAAGYDSLVFNPENQGQYLPLVFFNSQGVNYPGHGFFGLHTVVGTTRPTSTEAINALPAIVGASLAGVDKKNQYGHDFVLWAEDYFNKRPDENVYLNSPVTSSGDDWWYETMPNIYFYQLQSLYPNTGDFTNQFTTVADRWTQAVQAMGGSDVPWRLPQMNYRAWSLSTMTPQTNGVIEPEASGAIGWILAKAFRQSGNKNYRIAAEHSLEFLNSLTSNPSYELQLPYGTAAAAFMNAEYGTTYNIEKFLNWSFDVGSLRTWGAFTGNWGGYDVAGLIGENGSNGYAFIMNGFQQAGALLPVARYDERFARALGKWALNLANASRLFYSNYLPPENQDGREWSVLYDPNSYIAHEAMRQTKNGKTPFATGDAVDGNWGLTNLSLYSSSSVGYLGSMLDTTNVSGILRFDLLKTDFLKQESYPTYLYYNPYQQNKTVAVNLPTGSWKLHDAVTNTVLNASVSGSANLDIPADNAVVLVLLPAAGAVTYQYDKMFVNGIIADYHSGHYSGNNPPRIKSLNAPKKVIMQGELINIYCTAEDKDGDALTYTWRAGRGTLTGSSGAVQWRASQQTGYDTVICNVKDNSGASAEDTLVFQVVDYINHAPLINGINAAPNKVDLNKSVRAVCLASDIDGDTLIYHWEMNGAVLAGDGPDIQFVSPGASGNYYVECRVTDRFGLTAVDSTFLVVRDFGSTISGNLVAWYPCDGNGLDNSGNNNNAFVYSVQPVPDRNGIPNSAMRFDGASSYMQVRNTTQLNFANSITVAFWMTPKYFYEREQYPISHGNWERRWKFSISNKKIRWTVKTANGIRDVDSKTIFKLDSAYHVTGLYDGLGMELYVNGVLEAATTLSGPILATDLDLTIGEVIPGNSMYNYNGIMDEIRLYNCVLLPDSIQRLCGIYTSVEDGYAQKKRSGLKITAYPNPCSENFTVRIEATAGDIVNIEMKDLLGRNVKTIFRDFAKGETEEIITDISSVASGVYFLFARSKDKVQINKIMVLK